MVNQSSDNLQQIQAKLNASKLRLDQIETEMEYFASPQQNIPANIPANNHHKSILFYRDFRRFSGGHLKVWDYFNHVTHASNYFPYIYFSKETLWDASNPWLNINKKMKLSRPLTNPDIIFMEGMDWQILDNQYKVNSPVPIINLIQHVRHADPDNPRYPFLKYKAIRICVSEAVKTHLEKSGQVNGKLFVIPCGIDVNKLPQPIPYPQKKCEILIAGLKEQKIGQELKQKLELLGLREKVDLLTNQTLRRDYLQQINQAKITVFLPNKTEGEGFYLPALEAMALGAIVICPDCIGNRQFCLPGNNCFRPEYNLEAIVSAVKTALYLSPTQASQILANARGTVVKHNLSLERKAFLKILTKVEQLW